MLTPTFATRIKAWFGRPQADMSAVQQLVCDHVTIGYDAHTVVQSGLQATFRAGKLYALLGENGSGKSCLLQTLAGLLPVQQGLLRLTSAGQTVMVDRANPLVIEQRARWQGYLEQQPVVHWGVSVRQLVELAAFARRDWSQQQAAEAVEDALVACECLSLAERSVLQISAGERQRVMLARVLAAKPVVILVDEPTAGLDPRHQHAVMQLLQQQAEQGVMVICVMHDIALTRQYCDQAMLLEQPRLGASGAHYAKPELGPVAEVLTAQAVRRVFGIAG